MTVPAVLGSGHFVITSDTWVPKLSFGCWSRREAPGAHPQQSPGPALISPQLQQLFPVQPFKECFPHGKTTLSPHWGPRFDGHGLRRGSRRPQEWLSCRGNHRQRREDEQGQHWASHAQRTGKKESTLPLLPAREAGDRCIPSSHYPWHGHFLSRSARSSKAQL